MKTTITFNFNTLPENIKNYLSCPLSNSDEICATSDAINQVITMTRAIANEFSYELVEPEPDDRIAILNFIDIFKEFPDKYQTYSIEETIRSFFKEYVFD